MNILLIDDDKINNFLNRSIVEKHCGDECKVKEFTNPEDAFVYLKQCSASIDDNCPDVVFLDINMPEMSGFELLEKMIDEKVELPQTKIFILSSSLDPSDIERSKEFSMVVDFISKPLDKVKIEKIREIMA